MKYKKARQNFDVEEYKAICEEKYNLKQLIKTKLDENYIDPLDSALIDETENYKANNTEKNYVITEESIIAPASLVEEFNAFRESQNKAKTLSLNMKDLSDEKINEAKHKGKLFTRFETEPGQQAQIDFKENICVKLNDGSYCIYNIFVYMLSHSRFRLYYVTYDKSRETILHCLDSAFEATGGVPREIICDNLTPIMNSARTPRFVGIKNETIKQFERDYGTEFKPPIARRPNVKGKVEKAMCNLNEIHWLSCDYDEEGFYNKIATLNAKHNSKVVLGLGIISNLALKEDRIKLGALPEASIRRSYQHKIKNLPVNNFSMVVVNNTSYSVPIEYIGHRVDIENINGKLIFSYNRKIIRIHQENVAGLVYNFTDFVQINTKKGIFTASTDKEKIKLAYEKTKREQKK